ncbi:MAG: histidinol-phosphate transaminase [Gammaproteobacteria bacterium]|nr:histidinol-phosphate transaminase [Gammaproteobacteria bacterium]MCF6362080.1 histidinol-phosphate transaminase [Gammaproteobacteria bacterium]
MNRFEQWATPGVRGLHPYQPGKPIDELRRDYGVSDIIKLASNENPLGPSPCVHEVLAGKFAGLARYPDGNGFALKQALAERHDVDMAQITLGNGSSDVLEFVVRVFVQPGDEVLFSEHAFAMYSIVTQAVSGQAVVAPARDWGHDLEAMRSLISERTRVVFIANPNNPTGTWLPGDELQAFIAAVPERVVVVIDEAYFEYASSPALGAAGYPDASRWLSRFPNLLVTRTFSKAYGLAGLRVGYSLSHPDMANLLNRIRPPFNVNSLALVAAEAALVDEAHVQQAAHLNAEEMARVTDAVREMGLDFIPSVGNFVSIDVGGDAASVYDALLYAGVIVRPVANYGMLRHLRVTLGLAAENERFLAALRKVLRK